MPQANSSPFSGHGEKPQWSQRNTSTLTSEAIRPFLWTNLFKDQCIHWIEFFSLRMRSFAGCCEHGNESSMSLNYGQLLDETR
jgi:hypothetical protein